MCMATFRLVSGRAEVASRRIGNARFCHRHTRNMKYKKKALPSALAVGLLTLSVPVDVFAQTTPIQSAATAEQEQRLRQQQACEHDRIVQAPAVRAQQAASAEFPELPTETPCFRIERFAQASVWGICKLAFHSSSGCPA
ncbi:exported protein of unknown function (plasmid) [Ralstonia solanacearum CMR15]|nr:exported protein of unknown function [Ralstonia solanacearum CMR15]